LLYIPKLLTELGHAPEHFLDWFALEKFMLLAVLLHDEVSQPSIAIKYEIRVIDEATNMCEAFGAGFTTKMLVKLSLGERLQRKYLKPQQ
jgi:hypothetical protein